MSINSLDVVSQSVFHKALAYNIPTISNTQYSSLSFDKQERYLKRLQSQVLQQRYQNFRLDQTSMQADFAITSLVLSLESILFNHSTQVEDLKLLSFICNRAIHACNFDIFQERIEALISNILNQVQNDFQKEHILRQYQKACLKHGEFSKVLHTIHNPQTTEFESDADVEQTPNRSIVEKIRTQLVALLPDKQ